MLSVPTQSLDKWNIIIFYILNRPLTRASTPGAPGRSPPSRRGTASLVLFADSPAVVGP